MADSCNRFLIGLKRDLRLIREGCLMALEKWGFLQLEIIRKDHQIFEIDNVLNVIGEQGLQRFWISCPPVIVPKEHGGIPIQTIQFISINPGFLLAPFQAAGIAKIPQQISQIDVDLIQFDPEKALQKGNIEAPAVVSDNDLVPFYIFLEIIEVLALDVCENGLPVVERNRGYGVAPRVEASGFNIQVGSGFPEFRKKSPELVGRQKISEVIWISDR